MAEESLHVWIDVHCLVIFQPATRQQCCRVTSLSHWSNGRDPRTSENLRPLIAFYDPKKHRLAMATGSHLEYFLYDTWPRRRDWETNHYSILPPLKSIETTFPPNKWRISCLSDVLFHKKKRKPLRTPPSTTASPFDSAVRSSQGPSGPVARGGSSASSN